MLRSIIPIVFFFQGLALVAAGQLPANRMAVFNRAPLQKNAAMHLPLGSIKANGWLLKQLEQQRDGATGMAEELYNGDNQLGSNTDWLGGTGNSWEKVPYYVKGLVALAYTLKDPVLIAKAEKYIEWTLASQQENGQFGPPGLKDWWPRMPMMYALQNYYEATGDERVIPFLSKYFSYQLASLDRDPLRDWGRSRAADNIELVLWLYNRTGENSLLQLAQKLKEQAYPWVEILSHNTFYSFGDDFQPKHMVNISQALKFPSVYGQLSKKASDRNSMKKGIAHLMHDHGTPVGISSGTEFLAGRSSIQGVETCSVVEWMQSMETAACFLNDASIGDQLEKIAFNALPAQFDRTFHNHSYYTLPNQVVGIRGGQGFNQDYQTGIVSSPYSGFECCRYNMHMGWPYFVKNSWIATSEKGLATVAYGPMEVTTFVNGNVPIKIIETTGYPFEDQIRLELALGSSASFPLTLRIPYWSKNPSIEVNGRNVQGVRAGKMFTIRRTWQNGDQVMLKFPMEISVLPRVNNSVSIERGPIVYALDIKEEKKVFNQLPLKGFSEYELWPGSEWNYGLEGVEEIASRAKVVISSMPENPFDHTVTPVRIKVMGRKIPAWGLAAKGTSAMEVPYGPVSSLETAKEVTLVPYGSENLRLSCFPIIGTSVMRSTGFGENFDSGMPKDWVFYGGGWYARSGSLYAASNAGSRGYGIRGSKIVDHAVHYTDFAYSASLRLTSKGDAGLIFRLTDASIGPNAYKGYYVGLNPQRGTIEFGKANNDWVLIGSAPLEVQLNQTYLLKVVAIGDEFTFYLDNKLVLSSKDSTYKAGSIGLRTYDAQTVFDEVRVVAR